MLGGGAAEEMVLGEVSTGAENDLELATTLARRMICIYGMGEAVGWCIAPASLHVPARKRRQHPQVDCSPQTARDIDTEVKKLLDDGLCGMRRRYSANSAKRWSELPRS